MTPTTRETWPKASQSNNLVIDPWMDPAQEQRLLEEKTGQALAEARTKLDIAIAELSKGSADLVKKVWFAEESAEYSSALYSLTYGLEDVNPPAPARKRNADPSILVKESDQLLARATNLRGKAPLEGYVHLRAAVHKLRQSHHILERAQAKKS
jgi:hypothetical protein